MTAHKTREFKALVVFLTDDKNAASVKKAVAESARKPALAGLGMAVLNKSDDAVRAYGINTAADVKNTVLVYKDWTVRKSFVNLKADPSGLKQLEGAIGSITQ